MFWFTLIFPCLMIWTCEICNLIYWLCQFYKGSCIWRKYQLGDLYWQKVQCFTSWLRRYSQLKPEKYYWLLLPVMNIWSLWHVNYFHQRYYYLYQLLNMFFIIFKFWFSRSIYLWIRDCFSRNICDMIWQRDQTNYHHVY